jgi:hypothetical protein
MKATYVCFITIFRAGLQPYLKLATTYMRRDTLIKHKEIATICEETGSIIHQKKNMYFRLVFATKIPLVVSDKSHVIN